MGGGIEVFMKNCYKYIVIFSILIICEAVNLFAQSASTPYFTQNFSISFPLNNSKVNPDFSTNKEQLDTLVALLNGVSVLKSVTISASSSPDGAFWRNSVLAKERGEAVKRYIENFIGKMDLVVEEGIRMNFISEDWNGLKILVERDYFGEDREELISILSEGGDRVSNVRKKRKIKSLRGGETYKILMRDFMPQLRKSVVITIAVPSYLRDDRYFKLPKMEELKEPKVVSNQATFELMMNRVDIKATEKFEHRGEDRVKSGEFDEKEIVEGRGYREKEYIFNLKTNLLLPLLNVGVDIPLNERYSVGAEFYYPWIKPDSDEWCAQMLAWFVDGKYWLERKHAVGVYAGAGYYDFQDSDSGDQGEFVDVGVDYTFSTPIGRKKWMRLELNIGLGYIFTTARHYHPTEDYEHLIKDPTVERKNSHFVGPTRAGISLVFPIKNFFRGGSR